MFLDKASRGIGDGRATRLVAICAGFGFVVLSTFFTIAAVRRPLIDRQADLNVYYGAIHSVAHGTPLYSYAAVNGDPFTYPPFALLALWPIGWVSEPTLRVAWTLVTCAAVLTVAACLKRTLPGGMRPAAVWCAAVVLLVSAPLQSNLRFGQVSIFVVLLAFADAAGVTSRRWRGVLVGIAAAIKLTPLLFIGYLLVTGQRRAAATAAATFAACSSLSAAVLPSDSWTFWTHAVFTTSRVGDLSATGNQSINGILLRLPLMPTHRVAAWLLASLVVCAGALYRARSLYLDERYLEAAVTAGCATLAISPVSWMHHQVWTVLAGLLLLARPSLIRRAAATMILTVMICPLPVLTGRLAQLLATDARGLCAIAICCLGLVAAWRAARTPALSFAGRIILRPRALAVTGAAGLLLSGALVVTGLIHVRFFNPHGLVAARWRLALGHSTTGTKGQTSLSYPAPGPVTYTASYSAGHWVKAVGTTTSAVSRVQVKITSTGSIYTVPLFPGPQPGTHVFALVANSGGLSLIAYEAHGKTLNPYATNITVTYGPPGNPLKAA